MTATEGVIVARSEKAIFDELAALCISKGYVHAIAMFCFRDNMVGFDRQLTVDDISHFYSGAGLIRSEISTLIGLLVKRPLDFMLPPPSVMQAYMDGTEKLLQELHEAMSAVWFRNLDPERIADGFDPFSYGEAMREPIFYGPESAYNFQYRDLIPGKYAQDNDWLVSNRGFSINTARDVVHALGPMQNHTLRETLRRLQTQPSQNWTMLPAFTFTARQLAQWSGVDLTLVENVLTAFSLPIGNLNAEFGGLSDFNAANATPLLRRDDGRFILFQHYSLLEALYEAPFFWMVADPKYSPVASQHRGSFTEQFSRECLERVFGQSHVFATVDIIRKKGEKVGEMDVLVFFGNRAIVLQAKSKRLTLSARKGNDFQIKDDFRKAVQDAYDQAHTCAVELIAAESKLVGADGRTIDPPSEIIDIYPICIVADHYPALSFQTRQFLATQTSERIAPPIVTDVFALDVITEMLKSPLQFLSYLNLRSRFDDKLLVSNELTILSYHLQKNLWLDDKYDMLTLDESFSAPLDIAMAARRDHVAGAPTPDGILTRYQSLTIGRILEELDHQDDPLAVELGLLLLQLSEKALKTLSKGIDKVIAQTRRDGNAHDISMGFGSPPKGLTIHCNSRPNSEAIVRLRAHCEIRKHASKSDSWFGLIIRSEDGSVRLAAKVEHPWKPSEEMDETVRQFQSASRRNATRGRKKARPGRNDRCPCGSGKKI